MPYDEGPTGTPVDSEISSQQPSEVLTVVAIQFSGKPREGLFQANIISMGQPEVAVYLNMALSSCPIEVNGVKVSKHCYRCQNVSILLREIFWDQW